MVQIINGDIVQDNDPRLQQRSNRPHAAPARAPAGAGPPTRSRGGPPPAPVAGFTLAGFDSGLDFSAPAVKLVARPDAPGGIPDVELFALRVPGVGLLGVAAAGAFFGLKGLLAAAVLGYLYLRTGGGGGQPAPAAGRGTAAAGQSSGGFFMQQQQQQQEGFSASPQQQPAPGGQSSAFKGKAYKLGGS